eukprot:613200_1
MKQDATQRMYRKFNALSKRIHYNSLESLPSPSRPSTLRSAVGTRSRASTPQVSAHPCAFEKACVLRAWFVEVVRESSLLSVGRSEECSDKNTIVRVGGYSSLTGRVVYSGPVARRISARSVQCSRGLRYLLVGPMEITKFSGVPFIREPLLADTFSGGFPVDWWSHLIPRYKKSVPSHSPASTKTNVARCQAGDTPTDLCSIFRTPVSSTFTGKRTISQLSSSIRKEFDIFKDRRRFSIESMSTPEFYEPPDKLIPSSQSSKKRRLISRRSQIDISSKTPENDLLTPKQRKTSRTRRVLFQTSQNNNDFVRRIGYVTPSAPRRKRPNSCRITRKCRTALFDVRTLDGSIRGSR